MAADAAVVGRGICGWGAFSPGFDKLEGVFEGSLVNCLSYVGVRNDDAVAGARKQDYAERCIAAGAFLDKFTVGREANFMLVTLFGIATTSSNDGDHQPAFFEHSPWLTC